MGGTSPPQTPPVLRGTLSLCPLPTPTPRCLAPRSSNPLTHLRNVWPRAWYRSIVIHSIVASIQISGIRISSKVIDIDASRKSICNFLLVSNSTFWRRPISYGFQDIDAQATNWFPPPHPGLTTHSRSPVSRKQLKIQFSNNHKLLNSLLWGSSSSTVSYRSDSLASCYLPHTSSPQIWQSYRSNFWRMLGVPCRGTITGSTYSSNKVLSDYLNVYDHKPPTLQTDRQTDSHSHSNTALRRNYRRTQKLRSCLSSNCLRLAIGH